MDERTTGAMSLWQQTRTQRWALLIGLVVGIAIGATVALLFKPLIFAIILVLLAVLAYRVVRGMQRRGQGSDDGPAVRGMVITGRYGEPGPAPRASRTSPLDTFDDDIAPAAPAPPARDLRRGPEYDAEIDAILANIDRQIGEEGVRPSGRASRPAARPRTERPTPTDVQDADFHDR